MVAADRAFLQVYHRELSQTSLKVKKKGRRRLFRFVRTTGRRLAAKPLNP